MQQTLSLPHLLACLNEKDRYKGTQVYLNEIQRYNEQIYALVDEALKQTLVETKTSPMARLLSLRFFKEILISANFSLIDIIDERVEEQIVQIAQYNKKNKEVSRGANYFAEVHKLKNDAETQKISSSYVLLALEIVLMLGKWYTVDEDGEETRFAQYYHELTATGVVFPAENQLNFFKKDDEEKFKKNYSKWIEHFIQSSDAKKENSSAVNQNASKTTPQKIATSSQQQNIDKNKIIGKKQSQKSQMKGPPPTSKSESQVQSGKLAEIKQEIIVKDEAIAKLQALLKQQCEKSASLEKSLANKQQELINLKQQLKNMKQNKNKAVEQPLPSDYYQIMISPPKDTDDLIEQIDLLQDIVQQSKQAFEKQKNTALTHISQLQNQNQLLRQQIQHYEQQIQRFKQSEKENKLMQEQRIIEQRVFRQSQAESFHVTDEPKIGTKEMQEKQMITIKEQILTSRKEVLKDYSNTNGRLREQLSDICENRLDVSHKQPRQGSRSLKKTESQGRLKMNQTSMTAANFRKTNNAESKLVKTAQSFKSKDSMNKMVTIFPFLDTYFPPLPSESRHFKHHCLIQLNQSFFENQLLKVALSKPTIDCQSFYIYVYNKSNFQQKIKLLPNNACLSIEGEKVKKVPSLTAAEFELKLGAPDLNMRCPTLSIIIGNHGISLTTSTNEKVFRLPLPITLLDFFKIKKSVKRASDLQNISKTIKFGVDKFVISANLPGLDQIFPNLIGELHCGQTVWMGEIECGRSSIRLEMMQWSREMSITFQFADNCELSMSLSKVLLQILMWVLRE